MGFAAGVTSTTFGRVSTCIPFPRSLPKSRATQIFTLLQTALLSPTFAMTRKQYRRLTPQERHYLIEHYVDEPQAISVIAIHLQLEPKKVLEQARYLKLRTPNSHHSWSEAELHLLDEWAETKPLNQLVAS